MKAPKYTGRQIAGLLCSVEQTCSTIRLKIAGGNFKAWETDKDQLEVIADLLSDIERDFKAVQDDIDARLIAAEAAKEPQ